MDVTPVQMRVNYTVNIKTRLQYIRSMLIWITLFYLKVPSSI